MKILNRNQKGQGALEYLLLIGGAVLIAVIVIALLVGMGGQSRETAQDQASKAQKALEQPQPANIVSITADATDCTDGSYGVMSLNWQKLGEGGEDVLLVFDYEGNELSLDTNTTTADVETNLPNEAERDVNISGVEECQDTYWAEIQTTKNGQTVKSTQMKFTWE